MTCTARSSTLTLLWGALRPKLIGRRQRGGHAGSSDQRNQCTWLGEGCRVLGGSGHHCTPQTTTALRCTHSLQKGARLCITFVCAARGGKALRHSISCSVCSLNTRARACGYRRARVSVLLCILHLCVSVCLSVDLCKRDDTLPCLCRCVCVWRALACVCAQQHRRFAWCFSGENADGSRGLGSPEL